MSWRRVRAYIIKRLMCVCVPISLSTVEARCEAPLWLLVLELHLSRRSLLKQASKPMTAPKNQRDYPHSAIKHSWTTSIYILSYYGNRGPPLVQLGFRTRCSMVIPPPIKRNRSRIDSLAFVLSCPSLARRATAPSR